MTDVIVVGGGLAGLINAILLSRAGLDVILFEKKSYPQHKVCGEYISNEVRPFLERNDLFPAQQPSEINKFTLSSTNGKKADLNLKLGGFGISRYDLDHFLSQVADNSGVKIHQNSSVTSIQYIEDHFEVHLNEQVHRSKMVIAAHGKRSTIDVHLNRDFMTRRSPYIGVKRHIKFDFPEDRIALHNFQGGYCGISSVGGDIYNLCYLSHRDNLRRTKDIDTMEREILSENPFLKEIFDNADFLIDPMVINEISFEKKEPVENHLFMCGDAAGMITPLCGNGMAMAIHSAKILSKIILENWDYGLTNRKKIESEYAQAWHKQFAFRLWCGRKIQGLFGAKTTSNIGVRLAGIAPIANKIIGLTHGKPF